MMQARSAGSSLVVTLLTMDARWNSYSSRPPSGACHAQYDNRLTQCLLTPGNAEMTSRSCARHVTLLGAEASWFSGMADHAGRRAHAAKGRHLSQHLEQCGALWMLPDLSQQPVDRVAAAWELGVRLELRKLLCAEVLCSVKSPHRVAAAIAAAGHGDADHAVSACAGHHLQESEMCLAAQAVGNSALNHPS